MDAIDITITKKATITLFLRRCVAYCLDCIIVFIVAIPVFQGLTWLLSGGTFWNYLRSWALAQGWIMLSVVVPCWLYFSLTEASPWQATLGKRLLGLRVTDCAGRRLGTGRALWRNFVKLIPWQFVHIGLFAPTATGYAYMGQLPPEMSWWWAFTIIAYALTLLYLLIALITLGARSAHDYICMTKVSR